MVWEDPVPLPKGFKITSALFNWYTVHNPLALKSAVDRCAVGFYYPYVSVSNSSAETTIYSLSLPAGSLGPNGWVVVDISALLFNNTGGTRNYNLRVRLGGSQWAYYSTAINSHATSRVPIEWRFYIQNTGVANAQVIVVFAPGTGVPVAADTNSGASYILKWMTASLDTAALANLTVMWQWDAASTSLVAQFLAGRIFYFSS